MKTERNHSDEKLLFWKKVILTAEASEGKRTDWMRRHGISDGSYYYWHKVLADRGILDERSMDALDAIPLLEPIQSRCTDEQTFIEYPVNMAEKPTGCDGTYPGAVQAADAGVCHRRQHTGGRAQTRRLNRYLFLCCKYFRMFPKKYPTVYGQECPFWPYFLQNDRTVSV